jgi:transcriptional pleiotropic regulator of transition state genes
MVKYKKNDKRYKNMKSTGIVRNIDDLGRIVIPKSIRETRGIKIKDPMEFFVDGNSIIIKKYNPTCVFCGSEKDISFFKEQRICKDCLNTIKKI